MPFETSICEEVNNCLSTSGLLDVATYTSITPQYLGCVMTVGTSKAKWLVRFVIRPFVESRSDETPPNANTKQSRGQRAEKYLLDLDQPRITARDSFQNTRDEKKATKYEPIKLQLWDADVSGAGA